MASLALMRSLTKKMAKGDEVDQAITKVLNNLVRNFLIGYDPNATENDANLTKAQKLEKKN